MRCFIENDKAPGEHEITMVENFSRLPFQSFFNKIIVNAHAHKEQVFAAIGKHDEIWVRSPFEPETHSGEMLTAFLLIAKAAGWKGKKLINVLDPKHVKMTDEQIKLINELSIKGIMQYISLKDIYAKRLAYDAACTDE